MKKVPIVMSLTNQKTRPSLLPSLLKLQLKLRVSSWWLRAICFMASRLWSTNTGLFSRFSTFSYAFLHNYGKSDFVALRLFGICMNICQIWRQGCAVTLRSHNDFRSDGGKKHLFWRDCTKGKINNTGSGASLYVGFYKPVWTGDEHGMDVKTAYGMGGKRGEASSKNEMMIFERRQMRMRIWGAIAYR